MGKVDRQTKRERESWKRLGEQTQMKERGNKEEEEEAAEGRERGACVCVTSAVEEN